MQGLGNRSKSIFISIVGGKFVQRVKEGTPGSVTRLNKNNVTVHEMNYDHFTGILKGIQVLDGDYGKQWNFAFKAGDEDYVWTSPYSNNFSTAFLKMLPNMELSQAIKLSPSVKEVEGKNQSSLFCSQDDKIIKHAFTKDTVGYPQMEKLIVKGQEVWDDTKRMEYLQNVINDQILPKLGVSGVQVAVGTQNEATGQWGAEFEPTEAEKLANPELYEKKGEEGEEGWD